LVAIIFLVVTVTLSIAITRVGTIALTLTGMSYESAFFQARSAFYGVGYTTSESEMVVNHPVRRRIILILMVSGNLGIATMVATIIVSLMVSNSSGEWVKHLTLLSLGLAVIWLGSSSRWLNRSMSRLLTAALHRWTSLDVRDYLALLHLSTGYAVLEIKVQDDCFLAGKTLAELNLPRDGILVLGTQPPSGPFLGAPTGLTRIMAGDNLILYGPMERIESLSRRHKVPSLAVEGQEDLAKAA